MADLTKPAEPTIPKDPEAFSQLIRQAVSGDESTLPVLRKIMQLPGVADDFGGNLARQAEKALLQGLAGDNLLFREAVSRKLDLLRAELAGKDPTPIEQLLVERVVACWLQVQDADMRDAEVKNPSPAWAECSQRRMTYANRRYLAALKTLALVRKLAVPVLQVVLPPKPVNGAGSGPDRQIEPLGTNGYHRNGTAATVGH